MTYGGSIRRTRPAGSGCARAPWRYCNGRRRRAAASHRPRPGYGGWAASPQVRSFLDTVWPDVSAEQLVFSVLTDEAVLARAAEGLLTDEEQVGAALGPSTSDGQDGEVVGR